jgi:hypothetical protein
VTEFQNVANKAKDPDVKKFASDHLPTLKTHLDLAQTTASQLQKYQAQNKNEIVKFGPSERFSANA